jgi:UDP-N-acetylmuramate dehydrogenase
MSPIVDTRFVEILEGALGAGRVTVAASLAPFTTFHVGGPADYLIEARSEEELLVALATAREAGIPTTVLGGGSNVLISDRGVRGLVILSRDKSIDHAGATGIYAGAGLTINGLVRWTISRGLAGLETWAGTPGTVGGALHGNAHFEGRNIGEFVRSVRIVTPEGDVIELAQAAMEFAYDTSRLQRTGEIALSAVFNAGHGEPDELRQMARASLSYRKVTQPLDVPSAGCIFQNPDPGRDRVPDGIPPSAGALVDRAGLKGLEIDGARVSTTHGNFIVLDGQASASSIRALIDRCKRVVADRFGVALREEIVYVGDWDSSEP